MKRKSFRAAVCLLLAGTVLAAFVAIAADAGSQADPLVTLSYLNDTFLGQIMDKVDERIEARNTQLTQTMSEEIARRERELLLQVSGGTADYSGYGSASFMAVELYDGQELTGYAGCEVLLRSGSALCVSPNKSTPGLVDATAGGSINDGGALQANHLYLMTDTRGVRASGAVTLLVRGDFAVG